jgi:hypothetical protein
MQQGRWMPNNKNDENSYGKFASAQRSANSGENTKIMME